MIAMQQQFRRVLGEVAYTSNQIRGMLIHMGLGRYAGETKMRDYIKRHKLYVDLDELCIRRSKVIDTKYWVPKSRLVQIIEGMQIPTSEQNFEDAASELGYQV